MDRPFSEHIAQYLSPTILVSTSPSVEAISIKNGLSFTEHLRPFFQPQPAQPNTTHIKVLNNSVKEFKNFSYRVVHASEYQSLKMQQIKQYIQFKLSSTATLINSAQKAPQATSPQNLTGLISPTLEQSSSSYNTTNKEVLSSLPTPITSIPTHLLLSPYSYSPFHIINTLSGEHTLYSQNMSPGTPHNPTNLVLEYSDQSSHFYYYPAPEHRQVNVTDYIDDVASIGNGTYSSLTQSHILDGEFYSSKKVIKTFFSRLPDPTPWFSRLRAIISEFSHYSPLHFLDHPVAQIVAIASHEPFHNIQQLSYHHNTPEVIRQTISTNNDKTGTCNYDVYNSFVGKMDDLNYHTPVRYGAHQVHRIYTIVVDHDITQGLNIVELVLIYLKFHRDAPKMRKIRDMWNSRIFTTEFVLTELLLDVPWIRDYVNIREKGVWGTQIFHIPEKNVEKSEKIQSFGTNPSSLKTKSQENNNAHDIMKQLEQDASIEDEVYQFNRARKRGQKQLQTQLQQQDIDLPQNHSSSQTYDELDTLKSLPSALKVESASGLFCYLLLKSYQNPSKPVTKVNAEKALLPVISLPDVIEWVTTHNTTITACDVDSTSPSKFTLNPLTHQQHAISFNITRKINNPFLASLDEILTTNAIIVNNTLIPTILPSYIWIGCISWLFSLEHQRCVLANEQTTDIASLLSKTALTLNAIEGTTHSNTSTNSHDKTTTASFVALASSPNDTELNDECVVNASARRIDLNLASSMVSIVRYFNNTTYFKCIINILGSIESLALAVDVIATNQDMFSVYLSPTLHNSQFSSKTSRENVKKFLKSHCFGQIAAVSSINQPSSPVPKSDESKLADTIPTLYAPRNIGATRGRWDMNVKRHHILRNICESHALMAQHTHFQQTGNPLYLKTQRQNATTAGSVGKQSVSSSTSQHQSSSVLAKINATPGIGEFNQENVQLSFDLQNTFATDWVNKQKGFANLNTLPSIFRTLGSLYESSLLRMKQQGLLSRDVIQNTSNIESNTTTNNAIKNEIDHTTHITTFIERCFENNTDDDDILFPANLGLLAIQQQQRIIGFLTDVQTQYTQLLSSFDFSSFFIHKVSLSNYHLSANIFKPQTILGSTTGILSPTQLFEQLNTKNHQYYTYFAFPTLFTEASFPLDDSMKTTIGGILHHWSYDPTFSQQSTQSQGTHSQGKVVQNLRALTTLAPRTFSADLGLTMMSPADRIALDTRARKQINIRSAFTRIGNLSSRFQHTTTPPKDWYSPVLTVNPGMTHFAFLQPNLHRGFTRGLSTSLLVDKPIFTTPLPVSMCEMYGISAEMSKITRFNVKSRGNLSFDEASSGLTLETLGADDIYGEYSDLEEDEDDPDHSLHLTQQCTQNNQYYDNAGVDPIFVITPDGLQTPFYSQHTPLSILSLQSQVKRIMLSLATHIELLISQTHAKTLVKKSFTGGIRSLFKFGSSGGSSGSSSATTATGSNLAASLNSSEFQSNQQYYHNSLSRLFSPLINLCGCKECSHQSLLLLLPPQQQNLNVEGSFSLQEALSPVEYVLSPQFRLGLLMMLVQEYSHAITYFKHVLSNDSIKNVQFSSYIHQLLGICHALNDPTIDFSVYSSQSITHMTTALNGTMSIFPYRFSYAPHDAMIISLARIWIQAQSGSLRRLLTELGGLNKHITKSGDKVDDTLVKSPFSGLFCEENDEDSAEAYSSAAAQAQLLQSIPISNNILSLLFTNDVNSLVLRNIGLNNSTVGQFASLQPSDTQLISTITANSSNTLGNCGISSSSLALLLQNLIISGAHGQLYDVQMISALFATLMNDTGLQKDLKLDSFTSTFNEKDAKSPKTTIFSSSTAVQVKYDPTSPLVQSLTTLMALDIDESHYYFEAMVWDIFFALFDFFRMSSIYRRNDVHSNQAYANLLTLRSNFPTSESYNGVVSRKDQTRAFLARFAQCTCFVQETQFFGLFLQQQLTIGGKVKDLVKGSSSGSPPQSFVSFLDTYASQHLDQKLFSSFSGTNTLYIAGEMLKLVNATNSSIRGLYSINKQSTYPVPIQQPTCCISPFLLEQLAYAHLYSPKFVKTSPFLRKKPNSENINDMDGFHGSDDGEDGQDSAKIHLKIAQREHLDYACNDIEKQSNLQQYGIVMLLAARSYLTHGYYIYAIRSLLILFQIQVFMNITSFSVLIADLLSVALDWYASSILYAVRNNGKAKMGEISAQSAQKFTSQNSVKFYKAHKCSISLHTSSTISTALHKPRIDGLFGATLHYYQQIAVLNDIRRYAAMLSATTLMHSVTNNFLHCAAHLRQVTAKYVIAKNISMSYSILSNIEENLKTTVYFRENFHFLWNFPYFSQLPQKSSQISHNGISFDFHGGDCRYHHLPNNILHVQINSRQSPQNILDTLVAPYSASINDNMAIVTPCDCCQQRALNAPYGGSRSTGFLLHGGLYYGIYNTNSFLSNVARDTRQLPFLGKNLQYAGAVSTSSNGEQILVPYSVPSIALPKYSHLQQKTSRNAVNTTTTMSSAIPLKSLANTTNSNNISKTVDVQQILPYVFSEQQKFAMLQYETTQILKRVTLLMDFVNKSARNTENDDSDNLIDSNETTSRNTSTDGLYDVDDNTMLSFLVSDTTQKSRKIGDITSKSRQSVGNASYNLQSTLYGTGQLAQLLSNADGDSTIYHHKPIPISSPNDISRPLNSRLLAEMDSLSPETLEKNPRSEKSDKIDFLDESDEEDEKILDYIQLPIPMYTVLGVRCGAPHTRTTSLTIIAQHAKKDENLTEHCHDFCIDCCLCFNSLDTAPNQQKLHHDTLYQSPSLYSPLPYSQPLIHFPVLDSVLPQSTHLLSNLQHDQQPPTQSSSISANIIQHASLGTEQQSIITSANQAQMYISQVFKASLQNRGNVAAVTAKAQRVVEILTSGVNYPQNSINSDIFDNFETKNENYIIFENKSVENKTIGQDESNFVTRYLLADDENAPNVSIINDILHDYRNCSCICTCAQKADKIDKNANFPPLGSLPSYNPFTIPLFEPITIYLSLYNPLTVPLVCTDIVLFLSLESLFGENVQTLENSSQIRGNYTNSNGVYVNYENKTQMVPGMYQFNTSKAAITLQPGDIHIVELSGKVELTALKNCYNHLPLYFEEAAAHGDPTQNNLAKLFKNDNIISPEQGANGNSSKSPNQSSLMSMFYTDEEQQQIDETLNKLSPQNIQNSSSNNSPGQSPSHKYHQPPSIVVKTPYTMKTSLVPLITAKFSHITLKVNTVHSIFPLTPAAFDWLAHLSHKKQAIEMMELLRHNIGYKSHAINTTTYISSKNQLKQALNTSKYLPNDFNIQQNNQITRFINSHIIMNSINYHRTLLLHPILNAVKDIFPINASRHIFTSLTSYNRASLHEPRTINEFNDKLSETPTNYSNRYGDVAQAVLAVNYIENFNQLTHHNPVFSTSTMCGAGYYGYLLLFLNNPMYQLQLLYNSSHNIHQNKHKKGKHEHNKDNNTLYSMNRYDIPSSSHSFLVQLDHTNTKYQLNFNNYRDFKQQQIQSLQKSQKGADESYQSSKVVSLSSSFSRSTSGGPLVSAVPSRIHRKSIIQRDTGENVGVTSPTPIGTSVGASNTVNTREKEWYSGYTTYNNNAQLFSVPFSCIVPDSTHEVGQNSPNSTNIHDSYKQHLISSPYYQLFLEYLKGGSMYTKKQLSRQTGTKIQHNISYDKTILGYGDLLRNLPRSLSNSIQSNISTSFTNQPQTTILDLFHRLFGAPTRKVILPPFFHPFYKPLTANSILSGHVNAKLLTDQKNQQQNYNSNNAEKSEKAYKFVSLANKLSLTAILANDNTDELTYAPPKPSNWDNTQSFAKQTTIEKSGTILDTTDKSNQRSRTLPQFAADYTIIDACGMMECLLDTEHPANTINNIVHHYKLPPYLNPFALQHTTNTSYIRLVNIGYSPIFNISFDNSHQHHLSLFVKEIGYPESNDSEDLYEYTRNNEYLNTLVILPGQSVQIALSFRSTVIGLNDVNCMFTYNTITRSQYITGLECFPIEKYTKNIGDYEHLDGKINMITSSTRLQLIFLKYILFFLLNQQSGVQLQQRTTILQRSMTIGQIINILPSLFVHNVEIRKSAAVDETLPCPSCNKRQITPQRIKSLFKTVMLPKQRDTADIASHTVITNPSLSLSSHNPIGSHHFDVDSIFGSNLINSDHEDEDEFNHIFNKSHPVAAYSTPVHYKFQPPHVTPHVSTSSSFNNNSHENGDNDILITYQDYLDLLDILNNDHRLRYSVLSTKHDTSICDDIDENLFTDTFENPLLCDCSPFNSLLTLFDTRRHLQHTFSQEHLINNIPTQDSNNNKVATNIGLTNLDALLFSLFSTEITITSVMLSSIIHQLKGCFVDSIVYRDMFGNILQSSELSNNSTKTKYNCENNNAAFNFNLTIPKNGSISIMLQTTPRQPRSFVLFGGEGIFTTANPQSQSPTQHKNKSFYDMFQFCPTLAMLLDNGIDFTSYNCTDHRTAGVLYKQFASPLQPSIQSQKGSLNCDITIPTRCSDCNGLLSDIQRLHWFQRMIKNLENTTKSDTNTRNLNKVYAHQVPDCCCWQYDAAIAASSISFSSQHVNCVPALPPHPPQVMYSPNHIVRTNKTVLLEDQSLSLYHKQKEMVNPLSRYSNYTFYQYHPNHHIYQIDFYLESFTTTNISFSDNSTDDDGDNKNIMTTQRVEQYQSHYKLQQQLQLQQQPSTSRQTHNTTFPYTSSSNNLLSQSSSTSIMSNNNDHNGGESNSNGHNYQDTLYAGTLTQTAPTSSSSTATVTTVNNSHVSLAHTIRDHILSHKHEKLAQNDEKLKKLQERQKREYLASFLHITGRVRITTATPTTLLYPMTMNRALLYDYTLPTTYSDLLSVFLLNTFNNKKTSELQPQLQPSQLKIQPPTSSTLSYVPQIKLVNLSINNNNSKRDNISLYFLHSIDDSTAIAQNNINPATMIPKTWYDLHNIDSLDQFHLDSGNSKSELLQRRIDLLLYVMIFNKVMFNVNYISPTIKPTTFGERKGLHLLSLVSKYQHVYNSNVLTKQQIYPTSLTPPMIGLFKNFKIKELIFEQTQQQPPQTQHNTFSPTVVILPITIYVIYPNTSYLACLCKTQKNNITHIPVIYCIAYNYHQSIPSSALLASQLLFTNVAAPTVCLNTNLTAVLSQTPLTSFLTTQTSLLHHIPALSCTCTLCSVSSATSRNAAAATTTQTVNLTTSLPQSIISFKTAITHGLSQCTIPSSQPLTHMMSELYQNDSANTVTKLDRFDEVAAEVISALHTIFIPPDGNDNNSMVYINPCLVTLHHASVNETIVTNQDKCDLGRVIINARHGGEFRSSTVVTLHVPSL